MSAAPRLRETIERVLEEEEEGRDCLLVDLSEATFIDSTCIGLLVAAHQRLQSRVEGSMVVVCATRNVRKTFEIAGLDKLVEIEDRTEDAAPAAVT